MSTKMWDGFSKTDRKIMQDVAIMIDNKNYDQALKRAKDIKKGNKHFYQALNNVILWNKYSHSNLDDSIAFNDISRFVVDNDYFPNIEDLKSNVEKLTILKKVPPATYKQYYLRNNPENKETKLYILNESIESAKNSSLDFSTQELESKKIQALVSDIWINHSFKPKQEDEFLQQYGARLSEFDHVARIDRLLWSGRFKEAKENVELVSEDYKKLFTAIIKIKQNPKYINGIILTVPRRLRGSEHLQYRRAMFYHVNKREAELKTLLSNIPKNAKYSRKWWKLRHLYGRELLKEKKYKEAYSIISNHGLDSQEYEFSEAEWLSGWIALRFINKSKRASEHFKNMYDNVSYPISVSRASYWLGMSFESMNKNNAAIQWYKIAASYPTYFYGQVAIHKYRNMNEISLVNFSLPKEPNVLDNDIKLISYKIALKVAYILATTDDKEVALKILKNIIKTLNSRGKIAAIVKLVEEIGDDELTHKIYRYANRKNVFFIDKQFKVIQEIKDVPHSSLIHALIKQESGFAIGALSSVGAVGYMQVMPKTAQQVARKLKIKYSSKRLSNDVKYNVKIGSYYIDSLLKQFDDSKILAIASYNAGPNRTKKWIEEFYDPRDYSDSGDYNNNDLDKVIDWVELITYGETRNYVQRVMENLLVYNYLMAS